MTEQQEALQQLFNYAAGSLAEGKTKQTIVSELAKKGVPVSVAENIVRQADNYKKSEFRKGGMISVGIGIGLIVLGALITGATYSSAAPGGTYVVTTGLFLAGGIAVLRGLWRSIIG